MKEEEKVFFYLSLFTKKKYNEVLYKKNAMKWMKKKQNK